MSEPIRLNKFLAEKLGLSRRQVDEYIAHGRLQVNRRPAILGQRFTPDTDHLTLDGKIIDNQAQTHFTYLLFHKPVGYVCSRRAQGDNPTIYELLPQKYHLLKPVGRLDKDSSGLLLLTNDGDFAHQMTHPKFAKLKQYEVTLDQDLQPLHHQLINDHGINLPDGPSKLTLEKMQEGNSKNWLVTMHEGRNRQIRRTFAALGYTVTKLHRTTFGSYVLGHLDSGKYQDTKK